MKMSENLLLTCCSFLFSLLLISLVQTSLAIMNPPHVCSPSSCGTIRNISFPFRLKNDPKHCGYSDYELACENNVTLLYLNSQQKYKVKAINYHNFTIRLVDVSVNNDTCSFPNCSLYRHNFSHDYPYGTERYQYINYPINFMSCPHPLNNSSFFTDTNACANREKVLDASNSLSSRRIYIKVGHMNASDVTDMCRIDHIVMTSWKFKDVKNVSVSEIHDSLLYGFQLSWITYPCRKCKDKTYCSLHKDHTADCGIERELIFAAVVVLMIGALLIFVELKYFTSINISK